MPTTIERSLKPDSDNPVDHFVAHKFGRQANDVGIEMPSARIRRKLVLAYRSSNAGELIGHDAHAHPRPTYQHSTVGLAPLHSHGYARRNFGVLSGLMVRNLNLLDDVVQLLEQANDLVSDGNPAIV
jgi:hypothetical protein